MPLKTKKCSNCNYRFTQLIILNGSYICHHCYSKRYRFEPPLEDSFYL